MIGNGKIIDKDTLNSNGGNWTRLSYEMIFQEKPTRNNGYKTNIEVNELLKENDLKWEARLEEARQQVRKEALKEGYSEGKNDALNEVKQHLLPIREAITEVDGRINKLLNELKPHLANLVFGLTEKVLEVPVYNEELQHRVEDEVHRILGEIEEGTKVKIAVSPADYQIISGLDESGNLMKKTDIHYDESLNPGEYRIETRYEVIVKNFRKMLNDLKESTIISQSINLPDDVSLH